MRPDRDEDNPLTLENAGEARRPREALDRAGFEPKQIAELMGIKVQELASFRAASRNHAALACRTEDGSPLAAFCRLFLLGLSVDLETARRVFSPSTPEHWLEAGLLMPK